MEQDEIHDLESCRNCGIVVDVMKMQTRETNDKYDNIQFLWDCPVCKEENWRSTRSD